MHVLVTNDDGPPSTISSPYIGYLVEALHRLTDWDISVALPDSQRSWIGKAHLIGKTITASYIYPDLSENGLINCDYKGPFDNSVANNKNEEWVLLDGTPASCANIGIHHLIPEKGPVDLVISGPNYGRNSTALFIMSSGTIGASMEAALSGVKSVGVSFAFLTREHDPKLIRDAATLSVKIIQKLLTIWPKDGTVDLYSINVPLGPSLSDIINKPPKVYFTTILENRWGSCFKPIEHNKIENSDDKTIKYAELEDTTDKNIIPSRKQFKWHPVFDAVFKSVEESTGDNDGLAVHKGYISVTPLKATFQGVPGIKGELVLTKKLETIVVIGYKEKSYLYPILKNSVIQYLPNVGIHSFIPKDYENYNVIHIDEYENLLFEYGVSSEGRNKYFPCSYIYRKALTRKHFLAHTIEGYVAKHPSSILKKAFPETYNLEIDYAEFLDDSLDEADGLREAIQDGDKENKLWILKPSMSDKGQGIRIFKSLEDLENIFIDFEENEDEDEDEDNNIENNEEENTKVITSQMRHFIIQSYIDKPLLISKYNNKKFHVRVYVICIGSLSVYVCREMLSLFANETYDNNLNYTDVDSLGKHLTNTCLQNNSLKKNSVIRFWDLELNKKHLDEIYSQIKNIVTDIFKAALQERLYFQPLPNAFEIFGIDILIDSNYNTHLLEVNAYPDFAQTGDDLKSVIQSVWDSTFSLFPSLIQGVSVEKDKTYCDCVYTTDLQLN